MGYRLREILGYTAGKQNKETLLVIKFNYWSIKDPFTKQSGQVGKININAIPHNGSKCNVFLNYSLYGRSEQAGRHFKSIDQLIAQFNQYKDLSDLTPDTHYAIWSRNDKFCTTCTTQKNTNTRGDWYWTDYLMLTPDEVNRVYEWKMARDDKDAPDVKSKVALIAAFGGHHGTRLHEFVISKYGSFTNHLLMKALRDYINVYRNSPTLPQAMIDLQNDFEIMKSQRR